MYNNDPDLHDTPAEREAIGSVLPPLVPPPPQPFVSDPAPAQPIEDERREPLPVIMPIVPLTVETPPLPITPPQPSIASQPILAGPQFDYDELHDKPKGPWRARIAVMLVALLVFVGVGWGAFTLFGQNAGTNVASTTPGDSKASLTEYHGNGSDIIASTSPTTTYSCPSGYSSGATNAAPCIKTSTKITSAANYTCPAGYSASGSGSSLHCSTIVGGTKVTATPLTEYACASGYNASGSGASTTCAKVVTVGVITSYSCASGYVDNVNNSSQCTKTTTLANGTVSASCPSGYSASGSGASTTCSKTVAATAKVTESCSSGYSGPSGGDCTKTIAATLEHNCPAASGYTITKLNSTTCSTNECSTAQGWSGVMSGSKALCQPTTINKLIACTELGSTYVQISVSGNNHTCAKPVSCPSPYTEKDSDYCTTVTNNQYVCSSGTPYKTASECLVTVAAAKTTTYSCSSGSLSGSSCKVSASATLNCANGFTKSGSGSSTKCSQVSIDTSNGTPSYNCPGGYGQDGSGATARCSQTATATAKLSYSCPSGYTQSGTTCSKIVGGTLQQGAPTITYACPTGTVSSGGGSSETCKAETTSVVSPTQNYSCPSGWLTRTTGTVVDCVKTK